MYLNERAAVLRAITILQEQLGPSRDKSCPFCGDDGFDLIGLKLHLINPPICDAFVETPAVDTKEAPDVAR